MRVTTRAAQHEFLVSYGQQDGIRPTQTTVMSGTTMSACTGTVIIVIGPHELVEVTTGINCVQERKAPAIGLILKHGVQRRKASQTSTAQEARIIAIGPLLI